MKRKWAFGIVAIIGIAFWMRALSSWRPVTIAKVNLSPNHLEFSRDGNLLLVQNLEGGDGAVIDFEDNSIDYEPRTVSDFGQKHGGQTSPQVWVDLNSRRLFFSPTPSQTILLSGINLRNGLDFYLNAVLPFSTGWSKQSGEVYCALKGEIYIWDWNSGKLKRRIRFADVPPLKSIFSPDGSTLLTSQKDGFLRRYLVAEAKLIDVVNRYPPTSPTSFGFSTDSRFIWFVRGDPAISGRSFHVRSNGSPRLIGRTGWSANLSGPAKWLPDGRIGIVEADGFRWRNAKGETIKQSPGPFQPQITKGAQNEIKDWALSPDENWIYSAEQSGTIRRWRAR